MRVLYIEDEPIKYCAILRVLKRLDITDVTQVKTLEGALELIEKNEYDLYITDMHYPERMGSGDARSGEKFIQMMSESGNTVPIILCSSVNFNYPGILASIHYSKDGDWDIELEQILKKLL